MTVMPSSTTPLLSARALGKRYTVRPERSIALGLVRRNRPRSLWALHDLDLDVLPGEIVAVIGRNGAGKSTLLKLAAGVSKPTTGHLHRPRLVAPLIEVGAGFHPELTGRENVEVNARLLGLSARQIRDRFDDIVAFAELQHAIDQPVKQYSSGMFMRLGFAVAVYTEPEMLVVDEVLAVGDLPFQMRCLDRIREMRAAGVGVLFVSHNLAAVASLADRGVLLERGGVQCEGAVDEVIGAYHALLADQVTSDQGIGEDAAPTGELQIERVEVVDDAGEEPVLWQPGQRAHLRATLVAAAPVAGGVVGIRLHKEGAGLIAGWHETTSVAVPPLATGDEVVVECSLSLNVAGGGYLLDLAIARPDWTALLAGKKAAYRFGVATRGGAVGLADVDAEVRVLRAAEA